MKALKVIGLGVAIWGITLIWPEINQLLPSRVMAGIGLVLGIAILSYELWHYISQHYKKRGRPGSNHPTQPIPPASPA